MNIRKIPLVALILLTSGAADADVSANIYFASDYYYRGIFQAESSVSGGLDYERDGFYVGTWAADVKDGLEIDGYFGYGGELADGLGYSIGYTGYFYTGDFDDTYQEINLGSSLGLFTLDVAVGTYKNFSGPTQNYTHYSLGVEKNGFFGKYAAFSQDFAGTYFEAGYSATVADIDLGITLLSNDEDLNSDGKSDLALIFTVGKSFDLNFK
jgi:uncharacterized protein (TIGR02001 family)